jgi:aryl-alcohol dehydrogenase-like predicted oxidoreductase
MLLNGCFLRNKYFDPYDRVRLGKTGIRTSRLCMGTGLRGVNRQSEIIRTGYDYAVNLVREAYERGVRAFDSADLYGTHGVLYDALKGYPRKDYTIITKIWFLPRALPEAERPNAEILISRFLRELRTDYIDVVQLHCVTSENWNTELSEYMTSLNNLKRRGLIRAHGVSCHSLAAAETAVGESWVDTIHLRINPFGNKMDDSVEKVEAVAKQLKQAGKGIIGMKILGEGELTENDEQIDNCFRYVLQLGTIDLVTIGMIKSDEIVDTESRIRKVLI